MTNRWFSNIGNGTETGKTGGVHVSVDRAEIVKSAFCPHAPQYIPPISVYKRNTQLFHRRPPFSRGARGETRTREGRMDSYYPHCCRPPWIASVSFSHFRLRMYSYPRLFRSGGGRLFDGGKTDRSFVSNFLKLWVEVKAITKFSESFFPTASNTWKESSANRWFSCSYCLKQQQDATGKDGFEFRRWRYFLELKKKTNPAERKKGRRELIAVKRLKLTIPSRP